MGPSRTGSVALACATLLLVFAGWFPPAARGGAWTQPPGRGYLRASFAWQSSRVRFDENGKRVGLEAPGSPRHDTEYRAREIRIYSEYGLLSSFTPYGSLAYKRLRLLEPSAFVRPRFVPESVHSTSGLGDVTLGGRYRVRGSPVPLSVAAEIKVPGGYSSAAIPALGNGKVDVTLRGLAGASARWAYATADLGWTRRGGDYQDELLYSAEVGGRFAGGFYSWRGVLRGRRALGAPTPSAMDAFDPSLANPSVLELSAVVGAQVFSGVDVEVSSAHAVSGRNSLAGPVFEVGLAWSPRP